ncbi:MAG: hypothetical protein ACKVI4_16100, partial [Actinomycetales bacterium]
MVNRQYATAPKKSSSTHDEEARKRRRLADAAAARRRRVAEEEDDDDDEYDDDDEDDDDGEDGAAERGGEEDEEGAVGISGSGSDGEYMSEPGQPRSGGKYPVHSPHGGKRPRTPVSEPGGSDDEEEDDDDEEEVGARPAGAPDHHQLRLGLAAMLAAAEQEASEDDDDDSDYAEGSVVDDASGDEAVLAENATRDDEGLAGLAAIAKAPTKKAAAVPAPAAAAAEEPPDPEAEADLAASQKKTLVDKRILVYKRRFAAANTENTQLKRALVALVRACRHRGVDIPVAAQSAAGRVMEDPQLNSALPPVPSEASSIDLINGGGPTTVCHTVVKGVKFAMRMLNLPDTSAIDTPTRFPVTGPRFPTVIDKFAKSQEGLVAMTESWAMQRLQFGLFKIVNGRWQEADNHELGTDDVKFRLNLVYDDARTEVVTVPSLSEQKQKSLKYGVLSDPNVLNQGAEPLRAGKIHWTLKSLNVLSSMTVPMNRKFCYHLECLSEPFKGELDCHSVGFYNVSKSYAKGPKAP